MSRFFTLTTFASVLVLGQAVEVERPNFVLIMCDNLGYGDIGPFGSKLHRTPNLDRMTQEGMRLTSCYSASGVCTPSRAALMTGCYPRRVGLGWTVADGPVLRPVSQIGLHPDETTLAEVLKMEGYATVCIGKWHLGDQPVFLPTRQGFDSFLGLPYSDDMTRATGRRIGERLRGNRWPLLPLLQDEQVIEAPADRNTLTQRETAAAVKFIAANKANPFFLYLPHNMPGSSRAPFASEAFRGRSKNGAWGDAVEELDWAAGEIFEALKKCGVDRRTIVIWTSDNGAPRRDPPQGSNGALGGWGYTTAEGGMRVPAIVRWPGVVPPGNTSDELCSLMDLLPTLAKFAGAKLPSDRKLDGKDIAPLLLAKTGATTPHEAFYFYAHGELQAVRSGDWKLFFTRSKQAPKGEPAALYNLASDIGETTNVLDEHPGVVKRLAKLAERMRSDLGDDLTGARGSGTREPGFVKDAKPLTRRK